MRSKILKCSLLASVFFTNVDGMRLLPAPLIPGEQAANVLPLPSEEDYEELCSGVRDIFNGSVKRGPSIIVTLPAGSKKDATNGLNKFRCLFPSWLVAQHTFVHGPNEITGAKARITFNPVASHDDLVSPTPEELAAQQKAEEDKRARKEAKDAKAAEKKLKQEEEQAKSEQQKNERKVRSEEVRSFVGNLFPDLPTATADCAYKALLDQLNVDRSIDRAIDCAHELLRQMSPEDRALFLSQNFRNYLQGDSDKKAVLCELLERSISASNPGDLFSTLTGDEVFIECIREVAALVDKSLGAFSSSLSSYEVDFVVMAALLHSPLVSPRIISFPARSPMALLLQEAGLVRRLIQIIHPLSLMPLCDVFPLSRQPLRSGPSLTAICDKFVKTVKDGRVTFTKVQR